MWFSCISYWCPAGSWFWGRKGEEWGMGEAFFLQWCDRRVVVCAFCASSASFPPCHVISSLLCLTLSPQIQVDQVVPSGPSHLSAVLRSITTLSPAKAPVLRLCFFCCFFLFSGFCSFPSICPHSSLTKQNTHLLTVHQLWLANMRVEATS